MRGKAIVAALALAALGVSTALAAPPPGKNKHQPGTTTTGGTDTTTTTTTTGTDETTTTSSRKGKPPTSGTGCRPQVAVILRGTLAADGAAAPFSLSLTVTGGNRAAKAYKAGTQPVALDVTAATRVSRRGDHDPADLKTGDRANVEARACKADLAGGATPALTATRITAIPAKGSGSSGTTTTTDTTTTTSSP